RLRAWTLSAVPVVALGCVPEGWLAPDDPPVQTARAQAEKTDDKPPPTPTQAHCTAEPTPVRGPELKPKGLPVDLDSVLRLAEEQNPQIALAREKLNESHIEKDLADLSWLPNIHAGLAYYRHEGGIQNEDGTLQKSSTGALFPGLDMAAKIDPRDTAYQ